MLRLIYGTGNPAKLASMQKGLEGLDIEIIGLQDITTKVPNITESGNTPLENARIKAQAYYKKFGMPVFSCDSGLYFDNVPEDIQPGVHVRNVGGKVLTDQEMIDYYGGLAKKYGDLTARYHNAIVLIMDDTRIYEAEEESMSGAPFLITSKPHRIVKEGFPLDSLSIDIATGKYYYDMLADANGEVENLTDCEAGRGADMIDKMFYGFFEKILADELRRREQKLADLQEHMDADTLWKTITAFSGDTFRTAKGLEFSYTVKRNLDGSAGNEMFVDRKEKSITRSSVDKAFQKASELGEGSLPAVVSGPKKLGVFGASYLYPIFLRLGVIITP